MSANRSSPTTLLLLVTTFAAAACSGSTEPSSKGSLQITIVGLPATVTPSVTVTGPGSFSRVIASTTTLSGLALGPYVVTPTDVSVSKATYSAAASNVSVTGSSSPADDSVGYAPTTSFLSYVSDPGDYIGAGQTQDIAFGDATWAYQPTGSSGIQELGLTVVSTAGYSGFWWYIHFAPPQGQSLAVGSYLLATRWPFQAATAPGFDFSGSGRGCNMSTGQFEILSIGLAADNSVNWFHAKFEQHCENMSPALRGEVVIVTNPWR